ncbi:MAG: citrate synthase family protein [Myxococcales bacterium]|nr:citrate synthase family protein [Myxococcales bacterium]
MHSEPLSGYLTSEEAASALGVKRSTLYSYASRGLIRIAPAADRRQRMYLASDVETLRRRASAAKGHGPAAAAAMDFGQPVLESSITSIDLRGPAYRGHVATALAEGDVPFEAVAELLWGSELPGTAPRFTAPGLGVPAEALAQLLPAGAPPHVVLSTAVGALAAADPLRHALTEVAELARARRMVRRMAALLALCGPRTGWQARAEAALQAPTVAEAVLRAYGAPAQGAKAVQRVLVLCADHELNASSFTARVASGTGADLYAVVQAALCTLSGPRHGGLSDRVEAMLDEAEASGDVRAWLGERFRRGETVPGFGHPLYGEGDPRADALLAVAWAGGPSDRRQQALHALVQAMLEAGHPAPNIDVGLVAVRHAVGLPRGAAAALFALGRSAGWVAHAREQRASGRLLRPRARYVGPPSLP